MAVMVRQNVRRTAAQPRERHFFSGKGVSHRKRHLTVEIDVQNGDVRPTIRHSLQCHLDRRERPDNVETCIPQKPGQIHRDKHVVFHDHYADV